MNTMRNEQNLTNCYEFLNLSEKSWTLYFVSPDWMDLYKHFSRDFPFNKFLINAK